MRERLRPLEQHLWDLTERVSGRLKANALAGSTVTLKLKSVDFKTRTRARSLGHSTQLAASIFSAGRDLLSHEVGKTRFRLIGIGVSHLEDATGDDLFDLIDRPQVPGEAHIYPGYKHNGVGAHWRGIYDDKGRIMVAISYNSDLGDAWEWADAPHYPEKFSGFAIRLGVNYVIYAMTH